MFDLALKAYDPINGYDLPVFTGNVCNPETVIPAQFQNFCAAVTKTQYNISPLYRLDSLDWTILLMYFTILGVLAVYGLYRVKQVIEFWRYRSIVPTAAGHYNEDELPIITVQLPLFNEMYVVERLLKAVTEIDYPRDRLEIQGVDDSTEGTVKIGEATVAHYANAGFA